MLSTTPNHLRIIHSALSTYFATHSHFYLFPNRIESIGEENSLLAIEQINGIDSVQYRGYKCLQIKVRNSSKMNIFLRFETEPEYLQWRKELTICFTEVHRLNKRGPKLIKTAVSVHEEVTHNQAVARSRGDIQNGGNIKTKLFH